MNNKIAIQGISGSYHHEAAIQYFKQEVDLMECETFRQVARSVKEEKVSLAVMAIENTIAGSILPNYSLISRFGLHIIGETYLKIKHHLLCHKDTNLDQITEVHSHPMALLQCERFLEKLHGVRLVESIDTALSAKEISEKCYMNIATIAPKKAAEIYGLKILNNKIQTNPENYTRFFILSKTPNSNEEFNKVSIRFSLKNYSGSLVSVLQIIADCGANMSKIQSVPLVFEPGSYSFYVDFVIDKPSQYYELIEAMKIKINDIELLGKYNNGMPKWWKQND